MLDVRTSLRVDERLQELYQRHLPVENGQVTRYYQSGRGYYGPEEAQGEQHTFGIAIADLDGGLHEAGDHDRPFALQSLSKVFVHGLALADRGREEVLRYVGVKPSGDAFNSILLDERTNRPYNPMVNAGAIATTDLVRGKDPEEKLQRIVQMLRGYAGNDQLDVDPDIFEREWRTSDRNRAVAYLMRGQGIVDGDVEETLALYLRTCSVMVTCADIAMMAATLAAGGRNPVTGEEPIRPDHLRDVLSVMFTCGMYDFAGEWAVDVGVPAKSGVSGGTLVVVPGKMGLGILSPGLDVYGSSVRGVRVCQEISQRLGIHVFARDEDDSLLGPAAPASLASSGDGPGSG